MPTKVTSFGIADGSVTTDKITFSNALVPVGGIIMWSGSTIPTGWALCNGSNNTPDLRNRFIVGANSINKSGITTQAGPGFNITTGVSSTTYNPGDIGGLTAHKLTVDEIPSHNHPVNDPKHSHGGVYQFISGGGIAIGSGQGQGNFGGSTSSESTNISIDSTGGDKYHENRPPYYALAFIMRVS